MLATADGWTKIEEEHLIEWMHDHLRVIAVPVQDPEALDELETGVLAALDPPLNLAKMPKSPVRSRLTQLRKLHSKERDGLSGVVVSAAIEQLEP